MKNFKIIMLFLFLLNTVIYSKNLNNDPLKFKEPKTNTRKQRQQANTVNHTLLRTGSSGFVNRRASNIAYVNMRLALLITPEMKGSIGADVDVNTFTQYIMDDVNDFYQKEVGITFKTVTKIIRSTTNTTNFSTKKEIEKDIPKNASLKNKLEAIKWGSEASKMLKEMNVIYHIGIVLGNYDLKVGTQYPFNAVGYTGNARCNVLRAKTDCAYVTSFIKDNFNYNKTDIELRNLAKNYSNAVIREIAHLLNAKDVATNSSNLSYEQDPQEPGSGSTIMSQKANDEACNLSEWETSDFADYSIFKNPYFNAKNKEQIRDYVEALIDDSQTEKNNYSETLFVPITGKFGIDSMIFSNSKDKSSTIPPYTPFFIGEDLNRKTGDDGGAFIKYKTNVEQYCVGVTSSSFNGTDPCSPVNNSENVNDIPLFRSYPPREDGTCLRFFPRLDSPFYIDNNRIDLEETLHSQGAGKVSNKDLTFNVSASDPDGSKFYNLRHSVKVSGTTAFKMKNAIQYVCGFYRNPDGTRKNEFFNGSWPTTNVGKNSMPFLMATNASYKIIWDNSSTKTGTNINCAKVDILISNVDEKDDFGISKKGNLPIDGFNVIAKAVPNTGEYIWDIPDSEVIRGLISNPNQSTSYQNPLRIMIVGSDRNFYCLNPGGPFKIAAAERPNKPTNLQCYTKLNGERMLKWKNSDDILGIAYYGIYIVKKGEVFEGDDPGKALDNLIDTIHVWKKPIKDFNVISIANRPKIKAFLDLKNEYRVAVRAINVRGKYSILSQDIDITGGDFVFRSLKALDKGTRAMVTAFWDYREDIIKDAILGPGPTPRQGGKIAAMASTSPFSYQFKVFKEGNTTPIRTVTTTKKNYRASISKGVTENTKYTVKVTLLDAKGSPVLDSKKNPFEISRTVIPSTEGNKKRKTPKNNYIRAIANILKAQSKRYALIAIGAVTAASGIAAVISNEVVGQEDTDDDSQPATVTGLQLLYSEGETAGLVWNQPPTGTTNISEYVIYETSSKIPTDANHIITPEDIASWDEVGTTQYNSIELTNLDPGTEYNFVVVAKGNAEESLDDGSTNLANLSQICSKVIRVATVFEGPSSLYEFSENTKWGTYEQYRLEDIRLRWTMPNNMTGVRYRIYYKLKSENEYNNSLLLNTDQKTVLISRKTVSDWVRPTLRLTSNIEDHEFYVVAVKNGVESEPSPLFYISYDAPINLTSSNETKTSVSLKWDKRNYGPGQYDPHYSDNCDIYDGNTKIGNSSTKSFDANNLSEEIHYFTVVSNSNIKLSSERSQTLLKLAAPTNLKANNTSWNDAITNGVKLSWTAAPVVAPYYDVYAKLKNGILSKNINRYYIRLTSSPISATEFNVQPYFVEPGLSIYDYDFFLLRDGVLLVNLYLPTPVSDKIDSTLKWSPIPIETTYEVYANNKINNTERLLNATPIRNTTEFTLTPSMISTDMLNSNSFSVKAVANYRKSLKSDAISLTFDVTSPDNPQGVTSQCTPSSTPSNVSPGSFIKNVKLGIINNTTSYNSKYYNDYKIQVTGLNRGTTKQLVVTVLAQDLNLNATMVAYIDYNKNGIFDDSEKITFGKLSLKNKTIQTPLKFVSDFFTVPFWALDANTTLRVIYQRTGSVNPESINPCAAFGIGEAEDYTIFIVNEGARTASPQVVSTIIKDETAKPIEVELIENDIKIFPNPVSGDILNIIGVQEKSVYSITNTLGQIVSEGFIENKSLSTAKLAQGNYFLTVTIGEERIVKQFIKN